MDIIELLIIIALILFVLFGIVLAVKTANQSIEKSYQTQKQELFQCLQKTNQDFEWCYEKIIK